ncbi:hypothetical protein [Coleofasciculus sp.]|uniref:hypothetical protein n=1 Tax=Coleofasciculus sp. TaxID=3100458 RepID=UPI003A4C0F0D
MLEVTIFSVLVGNLGWQSVVVSTWLRWRQMIGSHDYQEEEEEIVMGFEAKEDSALLQQRQANGTIDRMSHPEQPSVDPQLVGWEFKIVRSHRDLFHKPAVFQQLCEEEALAGWILLEKLDDRRVRFKRLIALRNIIDPQQLPFDPYRCYYGSSWTARSGLGLVAVLIAIAVPAYLSYSLVSNLLHDSPESSPPSPYQDIPAQDFPPEP